MTRAVHTAILSKLAHPMWNIWVEALSDKDLLAICAAFFWAFAGLARSLREQQDMPMKSAGHMGADTGTHSQKTWDAIDPKVPFSVSITHSLHVNPRGSERVAVGRSETLHTAQSTSRTAGTLHLPARFPSRPE